MIRTVVVYCASSSKIDACYVAAAEELGRLLAESGVRCCNGAGGIGLMGALSNSALQHGGEVVGVIPRFMCEMGWQHTSLTQLEVVESMHDRKRRMMELADAAVALPGGVGTLEELFEVITWKQLGLFLKPIVIVNVNGFFTPLLRYLDSLIEAQFMREEHRKIWTVVDSPSQVLDAIAHAEAWDDSVRKIAAI